MKKIKEIQEEMKCIGEGIYKENRKLSIKSGTKLKKLEQIY